jgi:hypothetical protein
MGFTRFGPDLIWSFLGQSWALAAEIYFNEKVGAENSFSFTYFLEVAMRQLMKS